MVAFFKGVYDGELNLNPAEVEKAQLFTIEELRKMVGEEDMTPECLFGIKKFLL